VRRDQIHLPSRSENPRLASSTVGPAPALLGRVLEDIRLLLSSIKVPRQFDFTTELPRHPTGKLYKRLLRDAYWGKSGGTIA